MLPRRQPETEGEWFQLISDQLQTQAATTERLLEDIKVTTLQLRDVEQVIDRNFPELPRIVAEHDARIKVLETMYWRVTGVLLSVSAVIGFIEWLLSRR